MQKSMWLATTLPWLAGCIASGTGKETTDVPPAPPPNVRFAPSVTSYVSSSHRWVERDIAGVTHSDSMFFQYQLTAVITEADSGLAVSFAIDTVLAATARNIHSTDIAAASGSTYTALLSPTGRWYALNWEPAGSPLMEALAAQTTSIFPVLPAGGLLPSHSWVDSVEIERTEGGALLTFRVLTTYRSGEWNDAEGGMVIPIEWVKVYQVAGAGTQFGRPFSLQGEGTATGRSWFTRDGRFVGSVSEDDLVAQLEIDDLAMVTPVRQHQVDTVRVLQ